MPLRISDSVRSLFLLPALPAASACLFFAFSYGPAALLLLTCLLRLRPWGAGAVTDLNTACQQTNHRLLCRAQELEATNLPYMYQHQ
jgi:hypothetical protein